MICFLWSDTYTVFGLEYLKFYIFEEKKPMLFFFFKS